MTYCCDHIKKANELVNSARSEINWHWEESDNTGVGDYFAGAFTLNASWVKKASDLLDKAQGRLSRGNNFLRQAQNEFNACSCANYSELLNRCNRANNDFQEYKDKYEDVRDSRENERVQNSRNDEKLRGNISLLQNKLTNTQGLLTDSKNEVLRLKDSLSEDKTKIEDLNTQLNDLRLKDNNKGIENKDLKKNLMIKQKEALNETLNFKEYKLEVFINRLDIGLRKVRNLRHNYKELIATRERNNGIDVNNIAENNILENITLIQESFQEEDAVSISNVQKLCRKCEKLARLELEIEKYRQEQYQAQQEVPTT